MIVSVAEQAGPCDLTTLSRRANLPLDEVLERVRRLVDDGQLVMLGSMGTDADAVVYSSQGWQVLKSKTFTILRAHHNQYPLRRGAPAPELRSRLGLSQPVYQRVLSMLEDQGFLLEERQSVRLPEHEVTLTPEMERQTGRYLEALDSNPYSPPGDQPLDPELLGVLIDQGLVVRVTDSVVFAAAAYQEMTRRIVEHLKSEGSITVGEARTMFDTSRKYVLPLLEYMDQQQITRRSGDERVLR